MGDVYICPITDGLLYVEVPNFEQLVTLLIQQRWRRVAHLRTKEGYVPYFGGGIAFNAWNMILKGVKPLWFRRRGGMRQLEAFLEAVEEAYQMGFYDDFHDAEMHNGDPYPNECEWQGPSGLRFSTDDIEFVWVHWRVAEEIGPAVVKRRLYEFLPRDIPVLLERPEGHGTGGPKEPRPS
jgi:hypothetical protein